MLTKLLPSVMKSQSVRRLNTTLYCICCILNTVVCVEYRDVVLCVLCRKGELESAVKQLELYVEVADSVAAQARATSAIGTMYNTLVRFQHTPTHTHTNTHTGRL